VGVRDALLTEARSALWLQLLRFALLARFRGE
jgi:hypothetical protein